MFLGAVVFGKFNLMVRDLGGHLDFTFRARAGTLSNRVREATFWVFTLIWVQFVISICLLASMLQRLLVSPPRLLVFLGLL